MHLKVNVIFVARTSQGLMELCERRRDSVSANRSARKLKEKAGFQDSRW